MTLDTKQMSEEIEIAESTVRTWTKQFKIPHKRKGVKLVFSEEASTLFKTIKNLKSDQHGMNTIRAKIGIDRHDNQHDSMTTDMIENFSSHSQHDNRHVNMTTVIESSIEKSINQAIQNNNELSEKYARATYTLGQQERDISYLEKENTTLKEQLNQLPSPDKWESLQKKLKALEEENKQLKNIWWFKLFPFLKK